MKHEGPNFYLSSISRSGGLLTYILKNPTFDIWMVDLNQESPEAKPLKQTSANERSNVVSPDGKWLAYFSDKTGSYQLYLSPIDQPDAVTIPVSGVEAARVEAYEPWSRPLKWAAKDDRLFYRANVGRPDDSIWVVDVSTVDGIPQTSSPEELVKLPALTCDWDVDSEAERFLIAVASDGESRGRRGVDSDYSVVQVAANFFTVLNEKAPPAGAK